MKRCIALLSVICVLFSGCEILGERIKEPVIFYYIHGDYQETMGSVIVSEVREASGHEDDLSYLLKLYLLGPLDNEYVSPIPRGAKVLEIHQTQSHITLQLSDVSKVMSDADFSLASACLSLTCMDITGVQRVTVNSGEWSVTINRDILTLSDSSSNQPTEETK